MKHNPNIDLLRNFAAILVVWLHVTANIPFAENSLSVRCLTAVNAAGFIAVPLFVLISGALLLHQSAEESLFAFYKKRMNRILVPTIFWSFLFLLIARYQNPSITLKNMLFMCLRGKPYYHLWYMYMLVGLYLIAPALKILFRQISLCEQCWWCGIALVIPWGNDIVRICLNLPTESQHLFWDGFVPFIGLFLSGKILWDWAHMDSARRLRSWVGAAAVLCWV